jgi:pimeloyl-ACP methyl ester carboxylesterase
MTGNLVNINGHELYFEVAGAESGYPVVLLHHGLGSIYSWSEQIPALVEAGYRVIAYDRWGYGNSEQREQLCVPFFEDDLSDLDQLINFLKIRRAALIGHSDGGTIALYYAAKHPQLVSCIVTIAAHIYIEPNMHTGIDGLLKSYQNKERFREGMHRAHGDNADIVFQNWYRAWVQQDNLSWDMRAILKLISCPLLVVQGLEDEHAFPKHAEDLAESVPVSELWLANEVGHMLPQDAPQEFNRRLIAFLLDQCAQ